MAEQKPQEEQKEATTEQPTKDTSALEACQKELANYKDSYARLAADFQNFTKRLEKDRSSMKNAIQGAVILDVLAILDNFDRALQEKKEQAVSDVEWFKGLQLMRRDFDKLLEKYGVSQMTSYDSFDPQLHEAVMQVVSEKQTGTIVEVLQKGYMLGDHILRPAKVSIAQ